MVAVALKPLWFALLIATILLALASFSFALLVLALALALPVLLASFGPPALRDRAHVHR